MIFHSLSISDLFLIEEFKEAFNKDDVKHISTILYTNGMDTKLGVETNYCTHRNLRNNTVTCLRYEGKERTDKAWLHSGAASTEAKLFTKDTSLQAELRSLDPRNGKTDRSFDNDVECQVELPEFYD